MGYYGEKYTFFVNGKKYVLKQKETKAKLYGENGSIAEFDSCNVTFPYEFRPSYRKFVPIAKTINSIEDNVDYELALEYFCREMWGVSLFSLFLIFLSHKYQ